MDMWRSEAAEQGIANFEEYVQKSVVLSYFKLSSVSIVTEEVMKSRMDGRHAVMVGLLARTLAVVSAAITLRLLARTHENTHLMSAM